MTEHRPRARDRGEEAAEPPSARAELLRILAWAVAYAVAAWLGSLTVSDDSGFALSWPASGFALAWIATGPRRSRAVELALLGVLAAAAAYLVDGTVWSAVNGFLGTPLAVLVFLAAAGRWSPGLWGAGGTSEIETLRDYGRLLAATLLAGLVESLLALVVLLPEPGRPFERVGELAITHTVGMAAVGVTLFVVGGALRALPGRSSLGVAGALWQRIRAGELVQAVVGLGVTVLIFLAGFLWVTDAPVSFVLVMAVALVGIRFGAPLTALYALLVAAAASGLTAAGHGPIAAIPDPHRRALAFTVFTTAMIGTGLAIALSRRERDATIARLRESERTAEITADDLRLVLANLQEGVALVDESGRFIHANSAIGRLLEMSDFDDEQVQPVETYQLAHLDGRPLEEWEIPHARVFAGEDEVRDVLRLDRRDVPGERIFEVYSRLLPKIRETDLRRAVTMIRDVTAEHEQRTALTSFAQVVAHDLRNPLTSVELWATELLDSYRAGPVDPATATMMLRHVESAAGRMQNFISDLLAYAVARDQKPNPVRIELDEVIDSVVETIAALEGSQPEVSHSELPDVWSDPVLVPQLFDNLIGNARKYVADGVVPRIRIEATAEPDDWARIRVIDNGIGIAPEDRLRVFESFERAEPGYEGTGLGLAICRHIVERHGGTIAVTTPPDVAGTCIELTLPTTAEAFARATGAHD